MPPSAYRIASSFGRNRDKVGVVSEAKRIPRFATSLLLLALLLALLPAQRAQAQAAPAHSPRDTSARARANPATPISTRAGRRRRWPTSCAIRASIPRPSSPIWPPIRSTKFTQDDVGAGLRQHLEAALLHQSRRRLLSRAGAVGHHAHVWRPYFVRQRRPIGGRRSIRPTT